MTRKLIEWSARNKFFVLALTGAALVGAVAAMRRVPLDAIPDLSDTQVIIYSRWDRSPDILEDQVTYPIVTAMLGAPKVESIRAFTDFGYSYVYIIFEDGTDIYWARSRTIEYLSKILPTLPEGVRTELGPDATSVGWVFQYALTDPSGRLNLAQLRSLQDWYLRYQLQAVPGVAEVAAIGGFQRQYQVNVLPNALHSYNLTLAQVVDAIREGNNDVGARLLEFSGREYMVRARGYATSLKEIESIAVGHNPLTGTPILVKDVAQVRLGPELRRGVADLDGLGDAVGGIVIMRYGENALNVIERVKEKLEEVKPSLPPGVELVTTYDRSELISRAIATLKRTLVEELVIVSLVILLFLWHVPSALVPILTIPVAVVLAFIPMWWLGITSNIMSLAGIAISIGVLVDGAIVEVENAYKKLELWVEGGRKGDFHRVRLEALKEVGPSVFFSLLVIAVAFLPIFSLVDQEGRLFKPLAYTKNLSMAIAALLALTLDPALRMMFARMDPFTFKPSWAAKLATSALVGVYYKEEKHPVSRVLFRAYEPACAWVLKHKAKTLAAAGLLVASTVPAFLSLGSEFMPPLYEGSILYMPTALPGMSVTEAQRVLQAQDRVLKSFPEVERVFGKAGRAETSTDPAPFSMVETTVMLKPDHEWREKKRWYSGWAPRPLARVFAHVWPDRISYDELVRELDKAMRFPGIPNIWTQPIRNRIDMLSTGMRTPVGVKVFGKDLKIIERVATEVEAAARTVPGTRNVFAERVTGGYFVDFVLNREAIARFGLTIGEVEDVLMTAIGGMQATTTIEGRDRYPVLVRYARDYRDDLDDLKRVLVPIRGGAAAGAAGGGMGGMRGSAPSSAPSGQGMGAHVPLGELADLKLVEGPGMIRDEDGLLAGYVFIDMADRDIGGYVADLKKAVASVELPQGVTLSFSGQYENMQRVRERLKFVLPVTLFIIVLLLYMNTGSWVKTGIVLLAVPFSLIGAVWLMWVLDYNMSIAAWVGMIALMGLDAETGVFMLLFLDLSYEDAVRRGRMRTYDDLYQAVMHGAVKRVRPKLMTVMAALLGLFPIMWSVGTGADMMKRIAAPMIGGLVSSFLLELLIYPVVYTAWKWNWEMRQGRASPAELLATISLAPNGGEGGGEGAK